MAKRKKINPDLSVTTNATPPATVTTTVTTPPAPAPLVVVPVTPSVTTSTTKTTTPTSFSRSLLRSRKFIYGTLAMGLATSMYAWNVFLVTKYPYAQSSYLSLFNTMISFVAGLTSAVLGLHSWMEYTTAATNTISNSISSAISSTSAKTLNYNYTDDQKAENVNASRLSKSD